MRLETTRDTAEIVGRHISVLVPPDQARQLGQQARQRVQDLFSLDAAVELWAEGDEYRELMAVRDELATILIVSAVRVYEGLAKAPAEAYRSEEPALAVAVAPAGGAKCERCWMYSETVGAIRARA